jgi:hypothetical protein
VWSAPEAARLRLSAASAATQAAFDRNFPAACTTIASGRSWSHLSKAACTEACFGPCIRRGCSAGDSRLQTPVMVGHHVPAAARPYGLVLVIKMHHWTLIEHVVGRTTIFRWILVAADSIPASAGAGCTSCQLTRQRGHRCRGRDRAAGCGSRRHDRESGSRYCRHLVTAKCIAARSSTT